MFKSFPGPYDALASYRDDGLYLCAVVNGARIQDQFQVGIGDQARVLFHVAPCPPENPDTCSEVSLRTEAGRFASRAERLRVAY